MRGLIKILFLILLVVTLTACGVKILPKDTTEGIVDRKTNSIAIEKDGIKITIETMAWSFSPYFLEDYYTPLYVIVRNETPKGIDLRYDNFILFDNKGNQFRAIPPAIVKDSFLGYEPYISYRTLPQPYYYWDYWWTPYWYPVRPWPYPYTYYPYYWDYRYPYDTYEFRSDVVPKALPEGEILSNAQVRGFLYFQKATDYGESLNLKVSISGLTYNFLFEIKD
jgi:predicted small lipoprotein YifL